MKQSPSITFVLPPSLAALVDTPVSGLAAARTAQEATQLARRLNEASRQERERKAAEADRQRRESETLAASIRRWTPYPNRRPAAPSAIGNAYSFYAERERARQEHLSALYGDRR